MVRERGMAALIFHSWIALLICVAVVGLLGGTGETHTELVDF
jgi:hypothetical protein